MIFGPISILPFLLTTALSLSILGGGLYFIWGWYQGILVGVAYLVAGVAMTLFSVLGRPLMLLLLGSRRPATRPTEPPGAVVHRIAGPGDSQLYVEEIGAPGGPTLILTHGLAMNSTAWNYIKQSLSRRFRLLVWDLPGFGHSTKPSGQPYTMEMLAESLHEVVKLAGEGPVVLAGHSLGGMVTLTYCRTYSGELGRRVAGLILAQTTYINPVKTTKLAWLLTLLQRPVLQPLCYLMIWLSPVVRLMNVQNMLNGMAHLNCHLTGFAGTETAAELDFAAHYTIVSSPASIGRALLAMFKYDATDLLRQLPVPTLVITGDHDIVCIPAAGETIQNAVPRAQRSLVGPSGHLGLIEQNGAYSDLIAAWTAESALSRRTAEAQGVRAAS